MTVLDITVCKLQHLDLHSCYTNYNHKYKKNVKLNLDHKLHHALLVSFQLLSVTREEPKEK